MANTIILLSDVYETRERKEKELAYYREQLEVLRRKMFFIQKDIDITNICIQMIENEKVLDIKKLVDEKRDIE
jgi:prefoldin subunit 5